MKGLPDLRHLTNQTMLELGGAAVLVLLAVIVAIVLLRRARRRGGAPAMDDQPIDLGQRLGKLIDGVVPEPQQAATPVGSSTEAPPAATVATEAVEAAPGSAPLMPAQQTVYFSAGDATTMLGEEANASALSAWARSQAPAPATAPLEPTFVSAHAMREGTTAGIARYEDQVLGGAQIFDHRHFQAVWAPLAPAAGAAETAPLGGMTTAWGTAPLPRLDEESDAGWGPLTTADSFSTPPQEAPATVSPSHSEEAGGWEAEGAVAGQEAATPAVSNGAAGWNSGEWSDTPARAPDDKETAAGWAQDTGSLRLVQPHHQEEGEEPAGDEEGPDGDTWTRRLSLLGGGESDAATAEPAVPADQGEPLSVEHQGLEHRDQEHDGEREDEEHSDAEQDEDWDTPMRDLERLSSFPIAALPEENWPLVRMRGAPDEGDQQAGDEHDVVPASWAQPGATEELPEVGALPVEDIMAPEPVETSQSATLPGVTREEILAAPQPVNPEPIVTAAGAVEDIMAPPEVRGAPAPVELAPAAVGAAPTDLSLQPHDVQALETALAAIAALPDAQVAALVRRDGSAVAGSLQGHAQRDGADISAMLAATLSASSRCSGFARLGEFDGLTLVGRDGMLLAMETGPLTFLAVLTTKDARLGPMRRSLRRHVAGLKETLSRHYVS